MTPVDALQAVIAGEHAAIYVYGALGGRLAAFPEALAKSARANIRLTYDTHVARRDDLAERLRNLDAEPAPSAPAYELPGKASNTAEIIATAIEVERRCLSLYAQAIEATSKSDREWAFDALAAAAAQALALGAPPEELPAY